MNEKVKQFTELCFLSRTEGLTDEEHLKKIELANELVTDGIMKIDKGCYNFVDKINSEYFINRLKSK